MRKRGYTKEEVNIYLLDNYGTLLVGEWPGSQGKMEILCSCGKKFFKTWDDIKITNRGVCKECSAKLTSKRKLIKKQNEIREFFNSRGWKLENEFQSTSTVLKVSRGDEIISGKFNKLKYLDIFDDGNVNINKANNKLTNLINYFNKYNIKILNPESFNSGSIINHIFNLKCHCGGTFKSNKHNFMLKKHKGCNKCSSRRRLTKYEIKENIEGRGFNFIEVIEGNEKLIIFSNKIGEIFKRKLKDIIYEDLREDEYMKVKSKGEYRVSSYLLNRNITFETEKAFPDLKTENGGTPRFDFYLPQTDTIIEFHGSQHFEPHWDYEKGINVFLNLRRTMKNDLIKEEYCIINNIKLIKINYYEMRNIEGILDELL